MVTIVRDDTYMLNVILMDPIRIGRYGVEFYTRERYWSGCGTQDWPGTFMENCMYLMSCKDPTPAEKDALKNKKLVLYWKREISEPDGYSEFIHNSVLKNPDKYTDQIATGVHKVVDSWNPKYGEMKKDFEKYQKKQKPKERA